MALAIPSALDAFWSWWIGELRTVLPAAPRIGAARTKPLVIGFGPDGKYVFSDPRQGARRIKGTAEQIADAVRAAKSGNGLTILRLPPESTLSFAVDIPERAMRRAREILSLELESVTPFSVDDASFDFIADKTSQGGMRRVRQIVVKNAIVDAVVEDLRRGGVEVDRVDAEGAERIDLMPARLRRKERPRLRWRYAILAAGAVALVAGVYVRQARTIDSLTAQRDRLAAETEAVRMAAGDANAAAANIETLGKYAAANPAVLSTLASLTETLDDGVWLTELSVSGRDVTMSGFAASASKVINDLETSPSFAGAAFSDSVFTDQTTGTERFSAKARVESDPQDAPQGGEGGG